MMCDNDNGITLERNEDKVTITLDLWGIWSALPEEHKEAVLSDSAWWYIIKESLAYQLGKSLSTPSFNSSIHKLREMIVADPEFVNDITVTFIKQILEEWAKSAQEERKANQAFWKLYHQTRGVATEKTTYPSEINRGDDYMRVSTKEVRSEIMDKFSNLLKEEGGKE